MDPVVQNVTKEIDKIGNVLRPILNLRKQGATVLTTTDIEKLGAKKELSKSILDLTSCLQSSEKVLKACLMNLEILQLKLIKATEATSVDTNLIKDMIQSQIQSIVPDIISKIDDKILDKTETSKLQKLSYKDALSGGQDSESTMDAQIPHTQSEYGRKSAEVVVFDLAKQSGENDDENGSLVFEQISQNLADANVQVQFMYLNKAKKKVVAGFPNKEEQSKGQKINHQLAQENGVTVRMSKKMLPKLTVRNVSQEVFRGIDLTDDTTRTLQKERIIDQIKKRNPGIAPLCQDGHTLEVIYLKDTRFGKYYTVALKVSPSIRRYLLVEQGGRLYIGNQCYPFEDRFFIQVCYHCQNAGHMSNTCPKKTQKPVCMYCSNDHLSKECPNKNNRSQYKCNRCACSENDKISSNANTHTTNDPYCPMTLIDIEKLQANTEYLSKNVM